jgi:hypothetical protein
MMMIPPRRRPLTDCPEVHGLGDAGDIGVKVDVVQVQVDEELVEFVCAHLPDVVY